MKNIEYTCETRIIPGREGEPVKVIRLNDTDSMVHHVTEGEEYGLKLSYTHHFMSGPIADKLYAYESLGYSPEELKEIVEKHRRDVASRIAINSVYGSMRFPKISRADVERIMNTDSVEAKQMEAYIKADIAATQSLIHGLRDIIGDSKFKIKKVIFSDPATVVFWADGSKTVVKATNEKFDPEKGLAMAISKRALGDKGNYYETFKKHLKEDKK